MNKILSTTKEKLQAYWLYFIPHYLFSRLTYIITRTRHPLTTFLIRFYIKFFKVNMQEASKQKPDDYKTFCEFFTRKLKPGIHKINKSKNAIVSSCDGKILEYGKIKDNKFLQVKGKTISINEIMFYDKKIQNQYIDGSFVTIYLSPKDYHRVHMPFDGKLERTIHIPGRLFSVATHAVKQIKNLYCKNERLVCNFKNLDSKFAVIFVAAINVSSIETSWRGEISPPYPKKTITTDYMKKKVILSKGDEVGMFKSGSTVILLFDRKYKLAESLKKNKLIRVGEKIGIYS
ncbi:MAG: archaetidylserine decarboxylase [Pseudomonadota bacterium]|nr:archaetidylserine decarboxylase [Pseudomonadota bacterium]